jgi:hypothetical protein
MELEPDKLQNASQVHETVTQCSITSPVGMVSQVRGWEISISFLVQESAGNQIYMSRSLFNFANPLLHFFDRL